MQIFQKVILIIISVPIEGIEGRATNVCGLIVVFLSLFHKGVIGLFDTLVERILFDVGHISHLSKKIGSFLENTRHGIALLQQTSIMVNALPEYLRIHHPKCTNDGLLLEKWVI